jgi:SAM-dependent methyltransferase
VGDISAAPWLDYGCGNGGLVKYLRGKNVDAVGFDEGAIVPVARARGIPVLTGPELEAEVGHFSVVTMIEVIEHVPDPLPLLHKIRSLLKPGGILFLTTGNSAPYRRRFVDWRYVMPDIHVSYFDPHNMQMALQVTGFNPELVKCSAGWDDIIRFKVLKTLRWREVGVLEQSIPWRIISPLINHQTKSSHHPIGRAV